MVTLRLMKRLDLYIFSCLFGFILIISAFPTSHSTKKSSIHEAWNIVDPIPKNSLELQTAGDSSSDLNAIDRDINSNDPKNSNIELKIRSNGRRTRSRIQYSEQGTRVSISEKEMGLDLDEYTDKFFKLLDFIPLSRAKRRRYEPGKQLSTSPDIPLQNQWRKAPNAGLRSPPLRKLLARSETSAFLESRQGFSQTSTSTDLPTSAGTVRSSRDPTSTIHSSSSPTTSSVATPRATSTTSLIQVQQPPTTTQTTSERLMETLPPTTTTYIESMDLTSLLASRLRTETDVQQFLNRTVIIPPAVSTETIETPLTQNSFHESVTLISTVLLPQKTVTMHMTASSETETRSSLTTSYKRKALLTPSSSAPSYSTTIFTIVSASSTTKAAITSIASTGVEEADIENTNENTSHLKPYQNTTGIIAGSVAGGLGILGGAVAILIFYCCRARNKLNEKRDSISDDLLDSVPQSRGMSSTGAQGLMPAIAPKRKSRMDWVRFSRARGLVEVFELE